MPYKLTRFVVLMLVVVLTTIVNAQSESDRGVPNQELVNLAQYVPSDVDLFFTIRTDADFVTKITTFLETPFQNQNISINRPMVQQLIFSAVAAPFNGDANGIGGWLGERVAIAIPSLAGLLGDDFGTPTVIFETIDSAYADEYINDTYARNSSTRFTIERSVREDGVISYSVQDWDDQYYIQITDELVIVSPEFDYLGTLSDSSLSDSETFNNLIDQSPADAYDLVLYIEPTAIIEASKDVINDYALENEYRTTLANLVAQPIVIGFNIYDDRTLAFDTITANPTDDVPNAIDANMIRYVPSNALFVLHLTSVGESINQAQMSFLAVMDQVSRIGFEVEEELPFALQHLFTFLDLAFKGTTGVRAEELTQALDSDWLFYVSTVANTFNFLNVVRSSDTDLTDPVVDHMMDALLDVFSGAREEDDVLKFNIPANPILGDQEIWLGTQDDLIVLGTEHDFKYEPRADMVTLNTRRHYNYASSLFLENPSQLFYLNIGQIRSFLDILAQRSNEQNRREIRDVINLLNEFESVWGVVTVDENYTLTRTAMTLTDPETR
jgi:hypothetical protein